MAGKISMLVKENLPEIKVATKQDFYTGQQTNQIFKNLDLQKPVLFDFVVI